MAIVRWKPFDDIVRSMESEFESLMEDFFRERWPRRAFDETSSWFPRVDIAEDEDNITVTADIPGMKKDDIKITLTDNTLTISGEKKIKRDEKKENYHRVERICGTFSRSFFIPSSVDSEKISASYKDGVLKITLPKKEEAKPKEITIKAE